MSIKFLAEEDRPREKFLQKGKNALSDSELLAIIMGSGSREESAIDLARKMLNSVGNSWQNLGQLSIKDLTQFKGVGTVKAINIAAAIEIGRRRSSEEIIKKNKISSSNDAYQLLNIHLSDLRIEEFWGIFLNQNNSVLHQCKLSEGGITQSVVDVRVLFKIALEHYATAIIVAHNHPSGNLMASTQDKAITKQIKEAGNLLNIKLLDHLIISKNGYYSFSDDGQL